MGQCADAIVLQFVAQRSALAIDTGCVQSVDPGPFVLQRRARAGPRNRETFVMCRNIKTLFNFDPPATDDEIAASALQFVRKLSGFNAPSRK